MRDVLIIGGGPAGIGAAESLLKLGKSVTVLDIAPFAGGIPIQLSCKGAIECTRCHVCMPRDAADRINNSQKLEVHSMAKIVSATIRDDEIEVQVEVLPRRIRENKCIGCGKCIAVCPVSGAIIAPPHGALPNIPYIDRTKCAHFTSKKCNLCAEICPTDAIKFRDRTKRITHVARTVLITTGLEPIEPFGTEHYGYGAFPNVITSLDAERIITEQGELRRPSDLQKPNRVAIIQCAGSRTTKGGMEYCSKFCCKYGLRIARTLFERDPEIQIEFLYMDLRTFEPRAEAIKWARKEKNVIISQGVPGFVQPAANGNLALRRTSAFGKRIEEDEVDLVILSVGGQPRPETGILAELFSLEKDPIGFIKSKEGERRIFVAGSCREPMDIEESYIDGRATALAIAEQLGVSH